MEQNLPSASLSPEVPSSPNHLDVDSETSLPRVASSASFAPEACHIEDVDTGCQLHSHPSDLGLSRFNSNESTALVDSEAIHEAGEDVGNGQIQEEYQTDSEQANQGWYLPGNWNCNYVMQIHLDVTRRISNHWLMYTICQMYHHHWKRVDNQPLWNLQPSVFLSPLTSLRPRSMIPSCQCHLYPPPQWLSPRQW